MQDLGFIDFEKAIEKEEERRSKEIPTRLGIKKLKI